MIEIYGLPIAVHVRKVVVAALYKGLAFDNPPIFPFEPPPGWRELSPTGLIPAMRDGDFTLADSTAITLYLDAHYGGRRLVPEEPRAMAQAMFIDAYAGQTLFRNAIHGLFFQHKIGPLVFDRPTDQSAVDGILHGALPQSLDVLEARLGGLHFVGHAHSIGDVAVASNLINYCYLGYRLDPVTYPRLSAFLESMLVWGPVAEALTREAPFADKMGLDCRFVPGRG